MKLFELKLSVMVNCPATATVTVPGDNIEQVKLGLGDLLEALDKSPETTVQWGIEDDDINPENWDAIIEEWKEVEVK